MAIYTELIQSKVSKEQYKSLVLYCHNNKITVSELMRQQLGLKIEGKEW